MTIGLLIIDPQNDFHDIAPEKAPKRSSPALAVSGSSEDSKRLAAFIKANMAMIDESFLTLDTHAKYDIGHPDFWRDENGDQVQPFTEISQADIEAGRFVPVDSGMLAHAVDYARALEAGGRFKIMVWPEHCLKGSWGYQIFQPVKDALDIWSASKGREVYIKEKGKNPLTEHYGAFAAEYRIASDPETSLDTQFLDRLAKHDVILVGGQALSHCVGESVRQMVMTWPKELIKKIVLLRDTTSAVPGFEEFAENLVAELVSAGVQVKTTRDVENLWK